MNRFKKFPLTKKQKALWIFIGLALGSMVSSYVEAETIQEDVLVIVSMLYIGLIIIQPRKIKGRSQEMIKQEIEIEKDRIKQKREQERINRKKEKDRIKQEREQERINRKKEKDRIKQEKEQERIKQEKEQELIRQRAEEERIKQRIEEERINQEKINFLKDNFTNVLTHGQKIYISPIRNSLIILPYYELVKINSLNYLVEKEISLDKVLSVELAVEEEQITHGVAKQGKSKTRTSLTNMVVRGAVGSLVAGPVGGAVGALSASKKTKHKDQISNSRTKVVSNYSLVFYIAGETPIVIKMGRQETFANNALQQVVYLINQARELKEA